MAEVMSQSTEGIFADEGRDARVEDYLNDQLQTSTDLANIDSLLADVQNHQELLEQQVTFSNAASRCRSPDVHKLQKARQSLQKSLDTSNAHFTGLRKQATEFKFQQANIDRRLRIATQSETSDDAVQKLEASMESLRKLDVAKGYMELLQEVEQLSSEARRNFNNSPQAALDPYLRLQNLVNALKEAQPAAEDAAPHLIDHVDRTARNLWRQMKDSFAKEFENTLDKMQWPREDATLDGDLEQEWARAVTRLLELQDPELKLRDNQEPHAIARQEPLVLLPLEVMAKPLDLRFKYHFEGDRLTNKPDKVHVLLRILSAAADSHSLNTFFLML